MNLSDLQLQPFRPRKYSREPDPEMARDNDLLKAGKELEKQVGGAGFAGLWFHSETGAVWASMGDWAEKEDMDIVTNRLNKVPLVHKVRIEAEASPPRNGEWVQMYPKHGPWKEGKS